MSICIIETYIPFAKFDEKFERNILKFTEGAQL
jgi:hypothetical protein